MRCPSEVLFRACQEVASLRLWLAPPRLSGPPAGRLLLPACDKTGSDVGAVYRTDLLARAGRRSSGAVRWKSRLPPGALVCITAKAPVSATTWNAIVRWKTEELK